MTEERLNQRWKHIAAIVSAHIEELEKQGSFDEEVRDSLISACENVAGSPPPQGPTLEAIAAFDDHLDAIASARLAGAARMGRGTAEMVQTLCRLAIREMLLDVAEEALELGAAIHVFAAAHVVTMVPAYAGNQPLQPTTLANLLGGITGPLLRAVTRTEHTLREVNESPLGAGSVASYRFAPDRQAMASRLGFDRPVENVYDAVASVDYLRAAADSLDAVMTPVGNLVAELEILLLTVPESIVFPEEALRRLADVPQMRIPEPIAQLARGVQRTQLLTSSARDWTIRAERGPKLVLDEPLDDLLEAGNRCRSLLRDAQALLRGGFEVNRAVLGNRAGKGHLTSSDIIDFLVIEEGIAPGDARLIAGRLLAQIKDRGLEIAAIDKEMVDAAGLLVIGREIGIEFETLSKYLAPRRYLENRTGIGSPSPEATRRWLRSEADQIDDRRRILSGYRERFTGPA